MTSVVIAAHNEANVIGRCLDTLLADARPGEFEVVVVANGCTDRTAEQASARTGVRVLEIAEASKPKALNAGDAVVSSFPRIYLDADIVVSTAVARALRDSLVGDAGPARATETTRPLVAVPRRELNLTGRPLLVRGYFAIHMRLPVFRAGVFGRGMIALSSQGRSRFDQFPEMVADDLFLDSQFTPEEKCHVDHVVSVVAAPRRTHDLFSRLVRVRRGNSTMRAASATGEVSAAVRDADRLAWLRDVVKPEPKLAPAAVVYVAITAIAAARARSTRDPGATWERDESTRTDHTATKARGKHG